MTMIKTMLAATVATAAIAATAQAATTTNTQVLQGSGQVVATDLNGIEPNSSVYQFNWSATAFTAFAEFDVDSGFELTFDDYRPNEGNSNVSAFTFDRLDEIGGVAERFTTQTNFCDDAASPVGGTCDLITSDSNSGGNADDALHPASAVTVLSTVFGAGSYRLGFYDSGDPFQGSATFNVGSVSAVPVPAALPLFLTALAGLGFVSRRRAARAAA